MLSATSTSLDPDHAQKCAEVWCTVWNPIEPPCERFHGSLILLQVLCACAREVHDSNSTSGSGEREGRKSLNTRVTVVSTPTSLNPCTTKTFSGAFKPWGCKAGMNQQATAAEGKGPEWPRGPSAHVTFAACCLVSGKVQQGPSRSCFMQAAQQQLGTTVPHTYPWRQQYKSTMCRPRAAAGLLCVRHHIPSQPQQHGLRAQHDCLLHGGSSRLGREQQDHSASCHNQSKRSGHASQTRSHDSNHYNHHSGHTGRSQALCWSAPVQAKHRLQLVGPLLRAAANT